MSLRPFYEDGSVVIYHGDCREILSTLDAVDHVITDPPYSKDLYLKFRTNKGQRNFNDAKARREMQNGAIGSIDEMLPEIAAHITRLARRWVVVFHDAEIGHLWRAAMGERYVRAGVWVKPNAVPQISGDRPGQGFESMTIGHAAGTKRWNGGGKCAVWTVCGVNSQAGGRPDHPCPKPEELMCELVAQFTDPGDLILDPFGGSGTTAVAAKKLGRRCILIEREEKYCEVAARRLSFRFDTIDGGLFAQEAV